MKHKLISILRKNMGRKTRWKHDIIMILYKHGAYWIPHISKYICSVWVESRIVWSRIPQFFNTCISIHFKLFYWIFLSLLAAQVWGWLNGSISPCMKLCFIMSQKPIIRPIDLILCRLHILKLYARCKEDSWGNHECSLQRDSEF